MPKTHVTRETDIDAPRAEVFQQIGDFHRWPEWSPWLIGEPEAEVTYSEDGRSYAWKGRLIGEGSITRTAVDAPSSMTCELRILKPFKSTSTVGFRLEEAGEGTRVVWTMDGSLPLPLFWMKGMIEGMVGMDYERGLGMLKDLCETGSIPCRIEVAGNGLWEGATLIGLRGECGLSEIGGAMERDFKRVVEGMESAGLSPSAPPMSIYHKWDMAKRRCAYTVGIPVSEAPASPPAGLSVVDLPATPAYVVEHTGAYRHLGNAWMVGILHGRNKRFAQNKRRDPFEVYANDPADTPEAGRLTRLFFPMK